MSAIAQPLEASPASAPERAGRPLRVRLFIARPEHAALLTSALAESPGLQVVTDPAEPAELIVSDVTPALLRALTADRTMARGPASDGAPPTPREREVLQLLAAGASNKMIAHRLGISVATAKFHVAALLMKLGARTRSDAVAIGVRRGLLML
jgi:DNA-binding CsgD family transcriptional regulator